MCIRDSHHGVHVVGVGDVAVVGDRLAATRGDDVDDLVGIPAPALATHRGTEVVDDHDRAVTGELQGVTPTDPVSRARHDCNLAFEHAGHPGLPCG